VQRLSENLSHYIETLGDEFTVHDGVAIHNTAVIAHHVTIKAPAGTIVARLQLVEQNPQ